MSPRANISKQLAVLQSPILFNHKPACHLQGCCFELTLQWICVVPQSLHTSAAHPIASPWKTKECVCACVHVCVHVCVHACMHVCASGHPRHRLAPLSITAVTDRGRGRGRDRHKALTTRPGAVNPSKACVMLSQMLAMSLSAATLTAPVLDMAITPMTTPSCSTSPSNSTSRLHQTRSRQQREMLKTRGRGGGGRGGGGREKCESGLHTGTDTCTDSF